MNRAILLLFALAITDAKAAAQDLKPAHLQLQWEGWDITINKIVFTDVVFGWNDNPIRAQSGSTFVELGLTVRNTGHKGRSFDPENYLRIIIGEDAFDAYDTDLYYGNALIEPTLVRQRACHFELPQALIKDTFVIRFGGLDSVDVSVSITPLAKAESTVTLTTIPMTKEERDRLEQERIAKEEEKRKRLEKQEAKREANGDFSHAPGFTPEQREAAQKRWWEKQAEESVIGAKPYPQP
jgi:hypothetical protein